MSWLTDVGEDVLTLILEECDSGSLVALSATCQTLYSTIRSKEQRLSMKQITAMTDFFVLVDAGAVPLTLYVPLAKVYYLQKLAMQTDRLARRVVLKTENFKEMRTAAWKFSLAQDVRTGTRKQYRKTWTKKDKSLMATILDRQYRG